MTTTTYLTSATNETYSTEAFNYISSRKKDITDAGTILGISAGAIAGAMAEENTAYGTKDWILDEYARSGFDPNIAMATLPVAIAGGAAAVAAWAAENAAQLATTRTHAQGQAYYNAAKSFVGAPGMTDKILNPALIDAGPANFKIATAIDLVINCASKYPTLGLQAYLNDYSRLVADLMDPNGALTAKLYGLYMKEYAEPFFTTKNSAYAGQWDSLPQTFRDALLVTYTNRGEDSMLTGVKAPYEPQPGLTASGGMNHLLNAVAIGSSLGLSTYGSDVVGLSDFSSQALTAGEAGLAARYALQQLRYVAITGLDYSAKNTNGELDLYDPATDRGAMTEKYVIDRSAMLGWSIKLLEEGVASSIANPYQNAPDAYFNDYGSTTEIVLGNPAMGQMDRRHILFGSNAGETLNGSAQDDRLYGMGGADILNGGNGTDYLEGGTGNDELHGGGSNDELQGGADSDRLYGEDGNDHLYGGSGDDTLIGGAGDDYLEGGTGNDSYRINRGEGTDTILDTDGQGSLIHDGLSLSGGQLTAPNMWQDAQSNSYTLIDTGAGRHDLLIGTGSEHILLKDHQDGALGIHLAGEVAPDAFVQTGSGITVTGDRMPYQMPWSLWLWSSNPNWPYLFDSNGNMVRTAIPQPFYADKIFDTAGDDTIFAGDGFNVINAWNGGNNRIQTGLNDDYIVGGNGRDLIYSGGMTDVINAGAGDDIVYGENGRDVIEGGAGKDFLSGGAGADAINGGDGDDQIYGGDSITWAHAMTDSGAATSGQGELLAGGAGADVVVGDTASDALLGGEGDDFVAGREGDDILLGNSGLVFVAPPLSEFDAIIGAASWPMGPYMNFHSPFTTAPMLNIQFEKIDHGEGSLTRYEVTLTSRNNPEAPRENWMTPAVASGNDQLYGGSGNDWLFAGAGSDILDGGIGNDLLDATDEDNGKDLLDGGEGNDTLYGGNGHDELKGGADEDELYAGSDGSILIGGAGKDRLSGGDGDDNMNGGVGDDFYVSSKGSDSWIDDGGDDTYKISRSDYLAVGSETRIVDSDGIGHVVVDGEQIGNRGVTATSATTWRANSGAYALTLSGSSLWITLNNQTGISGEPGQVVVRGFSNSGAVLGISLPDFAPRHHPTMRQPWPWPLLTKRRAKTQPSPSLSRPAPSPMSTPATR